MKEEEEKKMNNIFKCFEKDIIEDYKNEQKKENENNESKVVKTIFKIIEKTDYLRKGAFGLVRKVIFKDKIYAAKLIEITDNKYESDKVTEFRGPGIVKVIKTVKRSYDDKEYCLIIMENAKLKSLGEVIPLLRDNLCNLIFKNPFDYVGENLLRFFTKQLIQGLEIFNRNSFQHFDIKPANILIFENVVLKFADFGLLRDINEIKDENNQVRIPGGTPGYLSPEYYLGTVDIKDAIKQDYFALGAVIYYMKYGEKMLNYNEYKKLNDEETDDQVCYINASILIDLLEKVMDKIKSDKSSNEDFIKFLCSLIHYKPEERPSFDEIYKNKWVNKNFDEINTISEVNNIFKEAKILLEINKSDYLINKRDYIYKKREKENISNSKKNKLNKHKFLFKPKKKN